MSDTIQEDWVALINQRMTDNYKMGIADYKEMVRAAITKCTYPEEQNLGCIDGCWTPTMIDPDELLKELGL